MVREDGETFLGIRADADWDAIMADEWLTENVVPHLPGGTDTKWYTDQELRNEIVEFCGDAPEFWAYYASHDWVALTNIFGKFDKLPKHWPMYVNDVKPIMAKFEIESMPTFATSKEHCALADALDVKTMCVDHLGIHEAINPAIRLKC